MTERLKLEIQTITMVHIIAIVLAILFFMILYLKANRDHALKAFLVVQIANILWMVFKIFKTVSPDVVARWWFIVGYYLCTCVLELAFLEFGYAYYKGQPLPKKVRRILMILPALQGLMVITNPYFHLLYRHYDFWGDKFGKGFYVHTAIEYGFIAVGFYYCVRKFNVQYKGKPLGQRLLVSAAILMPLVFNVLYIAKVVHKIFHLLGWTPFDVTPIAFTWSILAFVYATLHHDFLNLSPLMRHEVVHRLDTAICVLDSAYTPLYGNEKLYALLGEEALDVMDDLMKDRPSRFMIGPMKVATGDLVLQLQVQLLDSAVEKQYLILVEDVTIFNEIETETMALQEALDRSNMALEEAISALKESSKISARTFVARELHDIIGHSLVVAIKLLEVGKMYVKKEPGLCRVALADASGAIESGVEQMAKTTAIASQQSDYTLKQLQDSIERLFHTVGHTALKTQLLVKGRSYRLSHEVFEGLQKVVLEFLTNTLKHAEATEVLVSLSAERESLQCLLMDNGQGCEGLILGNGLRGINDRVEAMGGKVSYSTQAGEGFMCRIVIHSHSDQ